MFERIHLEAATQEHRHLIETAERNARHLPEPDSWLRRRIAAGRRRREERARNRDRGTVVNVPTAAELDPRLSRSTGLWAIEWPAG